MNELPPAARAAVDAARHDLDVAIGRAVDNRGVARTALQPEDQVQVAHEPGHLGGLVGRQPDHAAPETRHEGPRHVGAEVDLAPAPDAVKQRRGDLRR